MDISLFRSVAGQYQGLRRVSTTAMMNAVSHQIEDQVINHRMQIDFYAGFQRFSYFPEQLRRYGRLGAACRRVYVFGVPDVRPPSIPGVEFISIDPTSALAREWFVVADSPEFWTVLLTQETDGRDPISGGRRFDGIWTFDAQVVERASLLISQMQGTIYYPVKQRNHEQQNTHIAEISGRMVGKLETARLRNQRRWARLNTLHHFTEALLKSRQTPSLSVNHCPVHLLSDTVHLLRTMFGATNVVITLADSGNTYEVVAIDGEQAADQRTLRVGAGPSGRAITHGKMIVAADTRMSEDRDPLLPAAPTLIAVPIVGRRQIYGTITISGAEGQPWTEEDGKTVLAMAHMLAVSIEQRVEAISDGDAMSQVERAKRLEQAVISLRKPITNLLHLQQMLRIEGKLSPAQSALLEQIDALSSRLAQAIGAPTNPALLQREHNSDEYSRLT
jgi:DICT domain-containing protein